MKKMFLIAACWILSTVSVFAQSSLTSEELAFRNGIEKFLKEEGFVPTIDTEDQSVNFKKEGESYWITVTGSAPTYVEMHKSGFGTTDTNREYILEACNKATRETRCAKAFARESSVSFSVEVYCTTVEDFNYLFYKSISTLDTIKDRTKQYYNELDI